MKKDRLIEFQIYFDKIIKNCQNFTVFTRGQEFQIEACNQLNTLYIEISTYKEEMVNEQNEYAANILLSLGEIAVALNNEIQMILELKNDNPDKAWDYLIDAQIAIKTAIQVHPAGAYHLEEYVNRLSLIEKLFFPNQIFVSIGLIAIESKCSICNKIYGECNHVVGKAYMGRYCCEIITKSNLQEISIVENPSNKKCRMVTFVFDATNRNLMTYRKI